MFVSWASKTKKSWITCIIGKVLIKGVNFCMCVTFLHSIVRSKWTCIQKHGHTDRDLWSLCYDWHHAYNLEIEIKQMTLCLFQKCNNTWFSMWHIFNLLVWKLNMESFHTALIFPGCSNFTQPLAFVWFVTLTLTGVLCQMI